MAAANSRLSSRTSKPLKHPTTHPHLPRRHGRINPYPPPTPTPNPSQRSPHRQ
ncbi:hypothetical protein [Okeania sp. KiyG1]|uniref:hypothetical protein n=1 Tax=Okeania sp. KiyG1 TaxID=2720165 RepID=UPI001F15D171|nr:hypothetical protein [Okeania sp. KiyG1]